MNLMPICVEVLSGPRDGLSKAWPEGPEEVKLGNDPESSFLVVDYDPKFPSGGVRLRLEEGGVRIEAEGDSTLKGYGELFQLGQIWLRVRKEE
jgi:hypothetical protein